MSTAYNIKTGEIIACGTHIEHMRTADIDVVEETYTPGMGYFKNNVYYHFSKDQLSQKPEHRATWDINTLTWLDNISLQEKQSLKWAAIKDIAKFIDTSSIFIDSNEYQADYTSRDIMTRKLLLAVVLDRQSTFVIDWTDKNNNVVELNFNQLKNILTSIEDRAGRIKTKLEELRIEIFSSEDMSIIRWPDFI